MKRLWYLVLLLVVALSGPCAAGDDASGKTVPGVLMTLLVPIVSGALAGYAAYRAQERKLARELQLEDSAESVAFELLSDGEWRLRSFKVIRHHLGGFPDNDLRKILVRSGAIRFMAKSGEELWGLLERNRHRLGVTKIDADPANFDESELFGPA